MFGGARSVPSASAWGMVAMGGRRVIGESYLLVASLRDFFFGGRPSFFSGASSPAAISLASAVGSRAISSWCFRRQTRQLSRLTAVHDLQVTHLRRRLDFLTDAIPVALRAKCDSTTP